MRTTPIFMYPDWWVNANDSLLGAREIAAHDNLPDADIAARRIDAIMAFDRSAQLGQIRTPTLVLCARDDALTPVRFSEEIARAIPGACLSAPENGGHGYSEVHAQRFNHEVMAFLAQHSGDARGET
jgi:aminoacrylate hydrolase